jgi:acyl transferase domain-containing protein/NAD(P)-dependent dehydrogenase (short-subunit alcohol dehydrogenase family)/acyl carrier protein
MTRYDVAIIGMGCIFPAASSLARYWQNVLDGDSYFEPMPRHLWDMDRFYSKNRVKRQTTYTTIGAFIDPDIDFPFLEYRLPPKTLEGMDPAQLVTLAATRAALEDAGIAPRSRILEQGVTIIGASGVDGFAHTTTYLRRHRYFGELRARLEAADVSPARIEALEAELGPALKERGHGWNPGTAAVGNVPSSISNRVAQVFGIHGYNMTVDGACASSFAAIDVACQALCAGDARVVVTGGCDLGTNPGIYVGFAQMEGLSITGHSNPFDHTADGLVIGEGAGVVVLKRLEDAVADGDRVRAVIRGIGSSSDGAGQAIYAPSVTGRSHSFEAALRRARTAPSEVQFLEAHATSTIVGDAVEYDAIEQTYGRDPERTAPLLLGSVKHQIGHLKAAAGVAGLIKTVLAMEHATFPHMPRFEKLTPEASNPADDIVVPNETAPWRPHANGERVAAVTASGFGGVNYHVIIEQAERYSPPAARPAPPRDVAVVAVSCRVPGASEVEGFWDNVTAGRDVFTPVQGPEVGWHDHLDVGPENERITTRVVGLLKGFELNYLKHRIFPKSVSQISPTQFLALDLGERLLDQAGLGLREPKNIAVSVGTMHDDHYPTLCSPMFAEEYAAAVRACPSAQELPIETLERAIAEAGPAFEDQDPPVTEHTLPGWMTNVTAGRMANKLNLQGPNMTVDSACSSGLAALVPAVYQLMFGEVDAVITGGLNRQLSAEFTAGVCTLGAVAEDTPRPYDEKGKGFLIGEGGVFYLVRRLADAERDGDEIVAVIRSVHGSSEAESRSMVAPSELAVRRSIRNALERCPVPGDAIRVVDTHGSANPISDIVEANALAAELRGEDAGGPPVWITAIKSHVGHLYGGSGASSMLSTIQALRSGTVPGIRNFETLRPELEAVASKASPRAKTGPLEAGATSGGVNSLGLGGANYFAVLSLPEALSDDDRSAPRRPTPAVAADPIQTPPPTPTIPVSGHAPLPSAIPMPSQQRDNPLSDIFLRGAEARPALGAVLREALQAEAPTWLDARAWEQPLRLAIAAADDETLRARLKAAETMIERGLDLAPLESQGVFAHRHQADSPAPGLAFCFPGQGVHYVGMGRTLYRDDAQVRAVFDRVDAMARATFGFSLLEHVFGAEDDEAKVRALGTLVGAQTSLFAMEVALGRWLLGRGVQPDVLIGHSFGEICALCVAGAWDLEVGYQVVTERIHAAGIPASSGGPELGMMSLICSGPQRDALLALAGDQVVLTNVNAPGRYILAGVKQAIERTVEGARAFGAEAVLLPIGGAFHSRWMEPAREPFRKALASLPCSRPSHRLMSTVTGAYLEPEQVNAAFLAEHLAKQLVTPIDLPRDVGRLYADGVRHFLEVGPRWSLTKMVQGILGERPHRASFMLHPKIGDEESFRRGRAFLAATGHLQVEPPAPLTDLLDPRFLDFVAQAEPSLLQSLRTLHQRWAEAGLDEAEAPAPEASSTATAAPEAPEPTPLPAVAEPVQASVSVPDPSPPEEKEVAAADATTWTQRLTDKLVEATGYPADMLEPQLDLEADLGIDSVQRAEIWVALLTEHGMDTGLRPSGPRTIENLAAILASTGSQVAPVPVPAPAPVPDEPSKEPAPAPAPVPDPTSKVPSEAPAPEPEPADAALWTQRLTDKLVEATGYPADMLEPQLDLEADLGIDSVQRAEIWVALLTEHGMDTGLRPTGPRTIENLAAILASTGSQVAPVPVPAPAPVPDEPSKEPAPAPAPAPVPDPASKEPTEAPAPEPEPAAAELWTQRLTDKLVEATGYPADMLEPQLDLEADLGIDSVQRAEIWVALLTEHGMDTGLRPTGPRTIQNLAAILADANVGEDSMSSREPVPVPVPVPDPAFEEPTEAPAPEPEPEATPPEPSADPSDDDPEANILLAPGTVRLRREDDQPFPCKRVLAITADLGSSPVVDRLRAAGIEVMALHAAAVAGMNTAELGMALREQDTLLYLAHRDMVALDAPGAALAEALQQQLALLYRVFRAMSPVLAQRPLRVMVPISQDGGFGACRQGPATVLGSFPAGFVRSLQRELPDCRFQLLDCGELSWAEALEQRIDRVAPSLELGLATYGPVLPCSAPLGQVVRRGDLLRPGDLLLVTGGARGIVFECVRALAGLTGARLLLTGRTPLLEDRPDWLEASPETIDGALRELEIQRVRSRGMGLGAARRATSEARSQWELHRNLRLLDEAGIDARYEVCDVADRRALVKLIERAGRRETIRGVIHGAGVQRGRLLADLADEEVSRTVGTKLEPLFAMLDALDFSELRVFTAFGSVAGLFGNAGQTDYALANDLLAGAVAALARRWPSLQAQTVDWTAWTGTGMVSAEEEKRFEEAGLRPLDVQRGVRLFLDAVLGAEQPHLAAFNVTAAFADSRPIVAHPLTPRPAAKLYEPRPQGPSTVRFTRARDLWLDQHKVNGEPVVPGTFVTELFAQRAKLAGKGLRGVRFRRPMAVRERSLSVEILEVDDQLLALPRDRRDLPAKALHNLAFASCALAEPATDEPRKLKFAARELLALHGAAHESEAPFYGMLDERFAQALDTGPIFRGILATRRTDDRFLALVRLTDEALASLSLPGGFLVHPVLADMAVQVGAAWAMIEHDVMAIPWEIGELRVFGESQEREAIVVCQARELSAKTSVMDVMVREPDGRPIFALMGLTLEAIAAGDDDPEADTAQQPDEIELQPGKKKA